MRENLRHMVRIQFTKWKKRFCEIYKRRKSRYCGSWLGIRCFFDPRIRDRFSPDPGSQTHISESLVTFFFGQNNFSSLSIVSNFFSACSKIKLFNVIEIYGYKKFKTKILSPPPFCCCWIWDPGMEKNHYPGPGIIIPYPQQGKIYLLLTIVFLWWIFLEVDAKWIDIKKPHSKMWIKVGSVI